MKQWTLILLIPLLCPGRLPAAVDWVPFVIPVDIHPASEIARAAEPLTPRDRLTATDHFVTRSGDRVRLWGVNLTFAANFPTHTDAERIAKRLAAVGINSVRCHHMDTARWPRGLWDDTGTGLHPEALDRLDYFIDQLARHGIYTNLNLHVGAEHSKHRGLPEAPRPYDKMVNLFTPQLIDAQKDFARQLLTHKNPYRRNVAYANDAAIAVVEITNENSLFMWDADKTLRTLPPCYADILQKRYNAWLRDIYQTQTALERAWLDAGQPLGDNLLARPDLTETDAAAWNLEQHAGCAAARTVKTYQAKRALCLHPTRTDGTGWHLQYNQGSLNLQKGRTYTLTFEAAAPVERELAVGVLQNHEPWNNLGLMQTVTLGPEWKTGRMIFTALEDATNARLSFSFGQDDKPLCLAHARLQPGAVYELENNQSLDTATITLFGESDSPRRHIDRMVFLAETEKAFFDEMYRYIKNDLGCEAMVTGTIVFGPLGLYAQSGMDFIDAHAYWQHPRFPNRDWDMGDWLINQKPMSDFPDEGTLYRLAAERLAGKPFTVSEYNHPAPLDTQAECVPMIASFAAAQDWDGVWLYTYSHAGDEWDREHLNSFFDIDTNPAKWGFVNTGATIFRDAALEPLRQRYTGMSLPSEQRPEWLRGWADGHLSAGGELLKTLSPAIRKQIMPDHFTSSDAAMTWKDGLYAVAGEKMTVLTGRTGRFQDVQGGTVQIHHPAAATLTLVALDGRPLSASQRILITACGRCENTGMRFSDDRRTVGRHWGTAPVRIEPVEGVITLPTRPGEPARTCKVLNPDGTVKRQFPLTDGRVPLKGDDGTMWYLIERH